MAVAIYPYLSLGFVHEHTGVRFDECYFNDPEYRQQQDTIINRRLYEYFSLYWPEVASNYAHEPGYTVGVGVAYCIVAALFGSQIRYFDDFHPDCTASPLAEVVDVEQIQVPSVAETWPLSQYLDQYADLVAKCGHERVSLPGFASQGVLFPQYKGLGMHSPLTTAYKLRGLQLFADMVERPELAQRLFTVVRDTYYRICDLLIELLGLHTDMIFFGACSSSWVSEAVWRQWEKPAIAEIAARYGARPVVHSCGRSTHLLQALTELPGLLELHLGDQTDMALARRLAPKAGIYVVPDSVGWARDPVDQTCRSIQAIREAASAGPLAFQFVMEAGLTPETIRAVLDTVNRYNASHSS
jgi:hypothetical protein